MNTDKKQLLDRALEALARDDGLEFPDARLEERLRRAHDRGDRRRRLTPLSRAAGLLLFLGLSGLAVGGTLGFERLKAWWYSIQVDGQEIREVVEDGKPREFSFVSEDGYRVSVRVDRQSLDGQTVRTEFDAVEESGGEILKTSEVLEDTRAEGAGPSSGRRFDLSVLEEASRLHTWTTEAGEPRTLWLGPDLDGEGSWLLLERPDTEIEGPVELLQSTARPIALGGHVSIRQSAGGALEVELSDGQGWELLLSIASSDQAGPLQAPAEFTTPSGRVRVQTGD